LLSSTISTVFGIHELRRGGQRTGLPWAGGFPSEQDLRLYLQQSNLFGKTGRCAPVPRGSQDGFNPPCQKRVAVARPSNRLERKQDLQDGCVKVVRGGQIDDSTSIFLQKPQKWFGIFDAT
jgi:hypothetical protein